ncbi:PAS domain S-box protein [Nodosilinea sp. LEGE 07298]|uniref:PAS domain S-box protein n=1 Tax=Nodosilinea sp. LEGE 07298 TaxID=2777970 RepID=UPI00188014DA|nr:PAS domain S-box protein [Nodosilinea sp. LEGE 07298]MBE9111269.1 PAS domain S-box protein [Nodosilinea sp. LEGE 07298]
MTNDSDLAHQIEAVQALLSKMQQEAIAKQPDYPPELSASVRSTSIALEELQVVVEAIRLQNEALLAAQHRLEDERQRYQNLFDFAPDAYVVTDAQGTIEAINGLAAQLLNVSAPFAVGKPLTVFIAQGDHAFIYSHLNAIARQSEQAEAVDPAPMATVFLQNQELSIVPHGQGPLKVALSASAERDRRLYWLLRDTGDRKRLELALQTSEAQLSQILDSAIAVVVSFKVFENGDWEYNYFSSGCESILGYPPEAFMADKQLWRSRMHPDDLATVQPLFDHLFDERSTVWEYRFRHRDGSLRWLSSTYASQKIAEGCWQVTVVGHDISERKQAEAALRESEAKYRGLFDEIYEGYGIAEIIVNERNEPIDYRMIEVNPRFEVLTGLPRDLALSGRTIRDIAPAIEDQWHQIYGQVALSGIPTRFEQKVDDWGRWYDVYAFPVGDSALRQVGILFNDISERKRGEAERKRAEADLQASERKLRAAFNGTFEFMGLLTPEGTVIDVNRTALNAIAADLDTVVGQPFWQTPWWAHFPEQREQLRESIRRAANGETIRLETQHIWADGALAWLDFSLKPIVDEAGLVVMLMPEGRDITVCKHVAVALQRQVQQEYLLNDITEDIRQSLDLEAVLARAVERSRAMLESDRVIVFRFGGNGEGQVIAESVGHGLRPILASTIHDPCFSDRYVEAYRQGRVGAIDDLEQAGIEPCHANLLRQFQVRANLVVPILRSDAGPDDAGQNDAGPDERNTANNELWGLLIAHQCTAPRRWQSAEIALLKRIASKTSVAIQQSELYGQVLQELQKREQIQQVLQESEARFRTLSATAPIGISQIDDQGQCVYTNARWQEISGLSAAASLGKGWLQAVHPGDRPRLALAWEEYLAGRRQQIPEFRLLTPTNEVRWVRVAIAPMYTAAGDINGYVSTVEDITQRKESDRKLREQAALLDIASDAIFVRDLDHRLLYWNHGAERLYGWSPAEALDRPVHDLLRGDLPQLTSIMQTLYTEGDWHGELHEVTKTGQAVTVSARWTLVRDEAGQPRFILSVETDITEKKVLEAQFYQAQRLESLGRLSSGIAHDLNNVFTPILTMAQMLRYGPTGLGDSAQEQLRLLEDSAKRGISMVQQILSITRTSSGVRTQVELPLLLQDLSHMLEQSLPKQIKLQQVGFESGAALPRVSADPTQLHQVLMNLCVNARDAMPEGGTLTLAAQSVAIDAATVAINFDAQVGQYVRLTVADTGTGIDPEVRDRIFDPFFTTKGQGLGTGLGLATVLGIVKGSGGFVQVESEVGQGTQMHIYLPALSISQGNSPQSAGPEAPQPGQGEVILVVDDDDAVQQAMRSLLVNYNYSPLIASSGPEALDRCTQHQPNLVVLDIMMPGMDGLTLIQHLKNCQPDLAIVATSGLTTYEPAALAAGAKAFLPKPYDFRDLLKTITDLLR